PADPQGVVLVPHLVDEAYVRSMSLPNDWRIVSPDGPPEQVVAQIASAEVVVSSSLHGLITADSYGIPAIWARTINPLAGNNSVYKFHDHAGARGRPFIEPVSYDGAVGSPRLASWATTAARDIGTWQEELIAAFPLRALLGLEDPADRQAARRDAAG